MCIYWNSPLCLVLGLYWTCKESACAPIVLYLRRVIFFNIHTNIHICIKKERFVRMFVYDGFCCFQLTIFLWMWYEHTHFRIFQNNNNLLTSFEHIFYAKNNKTISLSRSCKKKRKKYVWFLYFTVIFLILQWNMTSPLASLLHILTRVSITQRDI